MKRLKLLLLLGAVTLFCCGCGESKEEAVQSLVVKEEETQGFPVAVADFGNVEKSISISCEYKSTESVDLAFEMDNRLIKKVNASKGDYVEKGQLLAQADITDVGDQLDNLKYEVQCLELELNQAREMWDFEIASADNLYENYTKKTVEDKKNLDKTKEGINKRYQASVQDIEDRLLFAKKRRDEKQTEFNQGSIYASIAGEITFSKKGAANTYTVKDETLFSISDIEKSYFVVSDTTYASSFSEGDVANIRYRIKGIDYSCEGYAYNVSSWENEMLFKTQSEEIVALGATGWLDLLIDKKENVLCLPVSAVHESDKGPFVYMVRDGMMEMQYVSLGLVGNTSVEITKGLNQGDQVALNR